MTFELYINQSFISLLELNDNREDKVIDFFLNLNTKSLFEEYKNVYLLNKEINKGNLKCLRDFNDRFNLLKKTYKCNISELVKILSNETRLLDINYWEKNDVNYYHFDDEKYGTIKKIEEVHLKIYSPIIYSF